MSTFTCPDGHASIAADYCDVCGAPLQPSAGPGSAAGGYSSGGYPGQGTFGGQASGDPGGYLDQAGTSYVTCPNCSAESVEGSLFCENCGYDFTTGAMPRPDPPSFDQLFGDPAPARSHGETPQAPHGYDPLSGPGSAPSHGTGGHGTQGYDPLTGPRPAPDPLAVPPPAPTSTPGVPEWVAEVWVDPGWYALQQSPDPCPSPGMPQVVPLAERSMLIGRRSTSRGIAPQIDCSADVGVSRRHAQLSTDGQRWWIEDLQSANGTYVGPASGPLPTDPVPPNQRHELDEGDRVYVGAWTRLVVRRAAPGEIAAATPGP